ncbi:CNH domain-containing protein [Hirsutella rhossiliensis]|uniref:CNH domain-containing protein n=1 Tax=Hirsutella rhossiliensis TaxID=111463 RepID=A0A9P8N3E8_9HYPO|nr:CNH domain-containing protein [Hirsutella rhossiliensis]KAH0963987.1 CNH domain-containing protein [Hirsutella rhossiliensis]
MSFRADDQRRYGHVPPVQYPVAGQKPDRQPVGRRLSFNTGDDAAYHDDQASDRPPTSVHGAQPPGADELFLDSPTASSSSMGRSPFGSTSSALSGYHPDTTPRTPPAQSTYNPQNFAHASGAAFRRSPSSAVPHHSHSSSRYSATSASSLGTSSFAPQTYNPAAYASTNPPQRQPTYPGYGHDQGYGAAVGSGASAVYGQSPGPSSRDQTPTYDPSQYAAGFYSTHGADAASQGSGPYSAIQAPYPVSSHIPVGPNYEFDDPPSLYNRPFRSDSQTSPRASPHVQPQSPAGLQRHPTNAPLPSRPMDELIDEEVYWDSNGRPLGREPSIDGLTSESIMQEIEAELGDGGRWPRRRPSPINGQLAREQAEQLRRCSPGAGPHSPSAHWASPAAGLHSIDYDDDDDDDDDPEGTAGVLAMQQAELDEQRFSGNAFMYRDVPAAVPSNPLPPPPEEDDIGSDSEFGGAVDLGMLSGNLTYGTTAGPHPDSSLATEGSRPLPTPDYYSSLHEGYNAEMDYGGTGGLQPPRVHRLSFDEGREESVSLHSRQSGTDSPTKNDHQDPYYPGLSSRPLPALPPGPDSDSSSMLSAHNSLRSQHQHHHSLSADARYYQADPEKFYQTTAHQTLQPERSISLSGHSHTPQVQAPTRSRTDAAEERKKMTRQHMMGLQHGPGFPESEVGSGFPPGAFDGITLPSGRKKKFVPSKLTASDFRRCQEPWALSGIETWVRSMGDAEIDLREKTIEEAVTNLFAFKVPTMNVADAEMLSGRVVQLMLKSGTLLPDEEWVKFGEGHISGVLWQMTGSGCYAPKLHDFETAGHCYSRQCSRSSKRMFLGSLLLEHEEENDWRIFHKLKPEDYEGRSNKELQLQFNLHEVVTGERTYLYQLEIFHALYRDELRARDPPVIHPDKIDKFLATVFRKLDTIFDINRDHLLSPLRYRRQEQAPWVVGFSDIFREWIRKAKADYLEFASGYPRAAYMIRKEADRNILFKKFIDDRQRHKLSSKQDWTHFLFQPIQRLQRYPLLLEAVEKLMLGESEERTNLIKAIQEIRAVVLECDARVAETTKRVQMMELDRMLVLRPGFQSVLNLDHLGRVLIREGELQRMGSKGMRWVDTHALLFDHYLILAKIVIYKDGKGEKKYDVSREPIPMPLLFLESMNDEPVTKQKGLEHAATGSSTNSLGAPASHDAEGKILYPFKLKHLGYEVYTLYASSAQNRQDWCMSIIEAKTRHAKALFSQNAEPFRLRVLADASFHYDASSVYARASGVPVKGTPLDRAIQETEDEMGSGQGIAPVCRAQVNCAAGFSAFGKSVIAIGTDYGVYVSDPSEPRGWHRTIQTARVTQIAILEEFSVCLVLADKSLISYPLDVVAPCSDFAPPINDNPRRAPQRLAKDVAYFATARMKDRMLVFYKRKEGLHTSFKVLEPILHKASEKRSRLFGGRRPAAGITDTFRDFDEFYLPTECYSLSVFHTYIAVSTAKGIEMLTLDKKQPMSIPDLKAQSIANIALRIRDQRPLGMFRLNDNEFILTYEDCAVYVDKHGDVSRTLIMEYTGKQKKARGATMYGQYLLLFNEDYVEVRNAENGRLRQIIAGRDVRVIDFGIRGPTGGNAAESQQSHLGQNGQLSDAGEVSKGTVKIAMCHPELPGKQIVLEMLLNDGHAE